MKSLDVFDVPLSAEPDARKHITTGSDALTPAQHEAFLRGSQRTGTTKLLGSIAVAGGWC
jgi:hypothetical protein